MTYIKKEEKIDNAVDKTNSVVEKTNSEVEKNSIQDRVLEESICISSPGSGSENDIFLQQQFKGSSVDVDKEGSIHVIKENGKEKQMKVLQIITILLTILI